MHHRRSARQPIVAVLTTRRRRHRHPPPTVVAMIGLFVILLGYLALAAWISSFKTPFGVNIQPAV